MAEHKGISKEALAHLESWLKSDVYRENLSFWERAWSPVKVPYTQLPDLPYLSQIPDRLNLHGARRVLDLGCGSGWLSIYLARNGFNVTGIDVSEHAVKLAQAWADKEDLNAHFDAGDIADRAIGVVRICKIASSMWSVDKRNMPIHCQRSEQRWLGQHKLTLAVGHR